MNKEYKEELLTTTVEIVDGLLKENKGITYDELREFASERIHEESELAIVYYYNILAILNSTENIEAIDEYECDDAFNGLSVWEILGKVAYWAYHTDLSTHVFEYIGELEDTSKNGTV